VAPYVDSVHFYVAEVLFLGALVFEVRRQIQQVNEQKDVSPNGQEPAKACLDGAFAFVRDAHLVPKDVETFE